MALRTGLVVLTLFGWMVAVPPNPCWAAKGIKKVVPPNTSRTWTGKIVGIDVANQIFRLESIQSKRTMVMVNGMPAPRTTKQASFVDLAVTPKTVVLRQDGLLLNQSMIQVGERVRVQSVGQTAGSITVYMPRPHTGYRGYVVRSRPHSYHPHYHYSQAHGHHLHANHHRRK